MDPERLLQRQTDLLLRQVSARDFLVQLPAFVRALCHEPRLDVHLADLRDDGERLARDFDVVDLDFVPELVALRDGLVVIRPDLDDSGVEPVDRVAPDWMDYAFSLAMFDAVVARDGRSRGGRRTKTAELIDILGSKVSELGSDGTGVEPLSGDTEEEGWLRDYGNLQERYRHRERALELEVWTSPAVALSLIDSTIEALNPEPRIRAADEDMGAIANELFMYVALGASNLASAVFGPARNAAAEPWVDGRVEELREAVERLREELLRRVGTTRSRLALIDRFKMRAEWHDRDRLRGLADAPEGRGHPEDRLTAELALYLFDQGLSPITKPMTGGLQPDLLDPTAPTFYLEAKQYTHGSNARRDLIRGVWQAQDTVGTLLGTIYEPEEAFVVIFRRGGPRYDLPDSIRVGPYTLYLRLIDIGPIEETGRRQRHVPQAIGPEELIRPAGDSNTEPSGGQ